jgi:hypothetical protein
MMKNALRKAQNVPLAGTSTVSFELHAPEAPSGLVSLLAVFQNTNGQCLATVAGDHGLVIDLAALPLGTDRAVVGVEVAAGSVGQIDGLRCTVRDGDSRDLAVLSGAAAGETSPDPIHLLGECYQGRNGWWFREIGYGLLDEAAIARTLGSDAVEHHRSRSSLARTAEPPKRRGLPPANLEAARMVGERWARGPVSLEIAVDLSGSMVSYSGLRREALRALAEFTHREMAAGDLLTSVAFADTAAVLVPPTDVLRLRGITDTPRAGVGGGTLLGPAIHLLMELRRPQPTGPDRSLMVITDGAVFDPPDALTDLLKQAGYQGIHLVVPKGECPDHRRFRGAVVRHFADADQLGLIYAEIFAAMTGQRLESR